MASRSGCLICGGELVYREDSGTAECYYCKGIHSSNGQCVKGHFVCDSCHSIPANELIKRYCGSTESNDPLEMASALMKSPHVNMHGPEHHFLVPAVLLASYYNGRNDEELKTGKLEEAEKRARNILGGYCGFYGCCGAGVGAGMAVSLITGATPLSNHEWKLSNMMTSLSLRSIADKGGPRCCKRTAFLSIIEAAGFLNQNLEADVKIAKNFECEFSPLNNECIKNRCPFYPGE